MHIETQSFIAIIEIEMENIGTIIQKAFKKIEWFYCSNIPIIGTNK